MRLLKSALTLTVSMPVLAQNEQRVDPEKKVIELGLDLSNTEEPVANYASTVRTGNLRYIAGHAPRIPGTNRDVSGKVPTKISVEGAKEAARFTAINLIATLKKYLGNLNRVKKIVYLGGMINSDPAFTEHSKVSNGASDLFVEVFGKDVGSHTRASAGMSSLPFNSTVEFTLIVEIGE